MDEIKTKVAIITGITGQDGPYLAELLINKGYKVVGVVRSSGSINTKNLDYLKITKKISFENCNLLDITSVLNMINKYEPIEIYNLASQSSVGASFSQPIETLDFNIRSVTNILESIKISNPKIKYYQASSSEMFGYVKKLPITEETAFHPVSPYGISKAAAHWITVNYREAYGLFTASGILFNHESFLRGDNFIIKKIINTALKIRDGLAEELVVGNIDIKRDFGFAPNYVEAMYLMMQKDVGSDYIISSGKSISLKDIIYYVFDKLKIDKGKIKIDKSLYRPHDILDIYGDCTKAKKELNWNYNMDFFKVLDLIIEECDKAHINS